jgi:hypothetical protein
LPLAKGKSATFALMCMTAHAKPPSRSHLFAAWRLCVSQSSRTAKIVKTPIATMVRKIPKFPP